MGDYVGPTFEPIGPVLAFNGVPRFGGVKDLTELFTPDGSINAFELASYVRGTIFIAAYFLAVYIVFLIFLAIFKCACKNKCRILAGLPFLDDYDNDSTLRSKTPLCRKLYRGFIIICTLVVIVNGFIFLGQGTINVQNIADDVRDGTDGFIQLSAKVSSTADSFIKFSEETADPLTNTLMNLIDESVCEPLSGTDVVQGLDESAAQLLEVLNTLQTFAVNDVTDIRDTFASDVKPFTESIEKRTDEYESHLNPANYAAPAITIGMLLLIGSIIAWYEYDIKIFFCMQTWFTMPVFFIFIFATLIIIAAIGTVLVANSDMCIGNPRGNPEGFMEKISELYLDDVQKAAANYYIVTGCTGEYIQLGEVKELLVQLDDALLKGKEFQALLMLNKQQLEAQCGGDNSLEVLEFTLAETVIAFDEVKVIGNDAIDLLTCEDINQIWIDIMHDAVCTSAPIALTWMFASMVAIYTAGMMIFVFRGALLPTKVVDNYKSIYEEKEEVKIEQAQFDDRDISPMKEEIRLILNEEDPQDSRCDAANCNTGSMFSTYLLGSAGRNEGIKQDKVDEDRDRSSHSHEDSVNHKNDESNEDKSNENKSNDGDNDKEKDEDTSEAANMNSKAE